MPGIDIIKDWESLKKQGLPALIIAVVWAITELTSTFTPKDPSCAQNVKFLQNENRELRRDDLKKDSLLNNLTNELLIKNHIIDDYHSAIKPYTKVLNH